MFLHYHDFDDVLYNEMKHSKMKPKAWFNTKMECYAESTTENKTLHYEKYMPLVTDAIHRAQSIDVNQSSIFPDPYGTRVYQIAEQIASG